MPGSAQYGNDALLFCPLYGLRDFSLAAPAEACEGPGADLAHTCEEGREEESVVGFMDGVDGELAEDVNVGRFSGPRPDGGDGWARGRRSHAAGAKEG